MALGVTPEGEREVLGLWIANNEGAKFWLSVMNNLKNRGLEDILIAVVDGLKGFPDAIIATARKLLSIIYDALKNGWVFEEFTEFKIKQNQCPAGQSS